MDTSSILAAIDEEIYRLEMAKAALRGIVSPAPKAKRKKLSKAARAKIAAAQKARWAAFKSKKK